MGSAAETLDLPPSNSAKLILVPATASEKLECWKINGSAWAGILSEEEYLDRERHLSEQALTRNGQITYWILTVGGGRPNQRPIFSACETVRKVGLVARRRRRGDERVEEVVCYGVGSVFCPPEYRGRGYAGRVMKELGGKLDNGWQLPSSASGQKAKFSILYSDIGQKFYGSFGWKPYASTHISFDPVSEEIYKSTAARLELPSPIDLTAAELDSEICPRDVSQTSSHLLALSRSDPSTTFVAIRPDYDHMSWHHAREEFYAEKTGKLFPTIKGATVPLTSLHHPSLSSNIDTPINPTLIWTRTYGRSLSHGTLYALRLILPLPLSTTRTPQQSPPPSPTLIKAIASLLLRAQLEASRWSMKTFDLWSPDACTLEAARLLLSSSVVEGGEGNRTTVVNQVEREKESICCLRWNGCERESGGDGGDREEGGVVRWIASEKYAWF